ncbi:MAG: T9SS type A sorting domain-containing protein [bacterium]
MKLMKLMVSFIKIRFILPIFILLSAIVCGQNQSVYFNIDYPSFIPVNSDFKISVIVNLKSIEYSSLDIYLMFDKDVRIKDVRLKTYNTEKSISFENTEYENYSGNVYKINVNLQDDALKGERVFQLVYSVHSADVLSSKMDFAVSYFKNRKIVKHYYSRKSARREFFPVTESLIFYSPQNIAGNALKLINGSKCNIGFSEQHSIANIMTEFWVKINSSKNEFFTVTSSSVSDTIIKLFRNQFGYLAANPQEKINYYSDQFLSENSWNFICIEISSSDYLLKAYINNRLILDMPVDPLLDFKKFNFVFKNDGADGSTEVDKIKIWDFCNDINLSLKNKNYSFYNADSSRCILSLDFNDETGKNLFKESSTFNLEESNIQYVKSNAPIFSRSPKVNAAVYSTYYAIDWDPQDGNSAKSFVVEKSVDGNKYTEIHFTDYKNDPTETYYYSDPLIPGTEIVYYRIKQINNDGSVVYSPQVKLGLGEKELFVLKQNYPNPFNPFTTISIDILEDTFIEIAVFNVVGKKLVTLHEGRINEGLHSFDFDGSNYPSGIYFCEVKSPNSTVVKKMLLAK